MTDLRKLDAAATQSYGEVYVEVDGIWARVVSNDMIGENLVEVATPEDAEFFAALVNAYRAGELVEVNKLHRYLGGAEDACDVRDDSGAVCGRLRCFHPKGASFDDLATALGDLAKIYRAMADGKLKPLTPEQMKEL